MVIYAIGIFDAEDPDRNPEVLRRLAAATGGEAFFPGEHDEVVAICDRIARDIRSQYTIGYASSSAARPGAWRTIQVVAGTPPKDKLSVRTRTGYIAAGESPCRKPRDGQVRILIAKAAVRRVLRLGHWVLGVSAVLMLGYSGLLWADGWYFQKAERRRFEQLLNERKPTAAISHTYCPRWQSAG